MESVPHTSDGSIPRRNTVAGENVFLFIPNLIGYARIVLSLLSFIFMPFQPAVAATSYLLSVVLDEFDGKAARMFDQATVFGSMLDMITDSAGPPSYVNKSLHSPAFKFDLEARCTTAGLLMFLCYLYPRYLLLFQTLLILDIAAHWMLTHAALVCSRVSHKAVDSTDYRLLQFYNISAVMTTLIFANELFFISLYVHSFTSGPEVSIFGRTLGFWSITAILTSPGFFLKHVVINIAQLVSACNKIATYDVITRANRQDFQRNGHLPVQRKTVDSQKSHRS